MGIEPTSDSDCRSTVLKPANRTSLTCVKTAFPQVRGLMRCPLHSPTNPSLPLVMAREWHAEINFSSRPETARSTGASGRRPAAGGRPRSWSSDLGS